MSLTKNQFSHFLKIFEIDLETTITKDKEIGVLN